jgi:tRNA (cmo5U34)-methyltransferase
MDQEQAHRHQELSALVSFLSYSPDAAIQVLELGAGHGLLTATLLERFPHAHVLALDVSPTMIEEGRQRLELFGSRVQFRQCDLGEPGWPLETEGPFHAAISSLALHHLGRARRSELAREIVRRLRPGGFFLNLDYVGAASETLGQRYRFAEAVLGDSGHHGGSSHAHDSLQSQVEDLVAAGFEDVDVFWKRGHLALLGGTRPHYA